MTKRNLLIIGAVVTVLIVWSVLQATSGFMGRKMVENVMERAADGNADVNMKADGTMDITTEDGEFSTGNSVPKDWPADVPTYTQATITYSATMNPTDGKTGIILVLTTTDSAADVKAFYETELKTNGWRIMNTMQGNDTVIMIADKDGRALSIAIAEAEGKTGITLSVEAETK